MLQKIISPIRHVLKHLKYSGYARLCPVCNRRSSKFAAYGAVPRNDAQCVWCGALERHRLVWLFLQRKTDLFSNQDPSREMVHIAPEPCFEARFRQVIGKGYLTADLFAKDVDVKMDISDIHYPDATFDIIYCSHVLEFVPDDRKAMREFCRVLKPTGWAILMEPIQARQTQEEAEVLGAQERARLFIEKGQVRRYGPDLQDRLEAAGFSAHRIVPADFLTVTERDQMGITEGVGQILFCRRQPAKMAASVV